MPRAGESGDQARVGEAINATTAAGVLPADLGGKATTDQITRTLLDNLAEPGVSP